MPDPIAHELTFLFTDVEGSTQLLERLGPGYGIVLEKHRALITLGDRVERRPRRRLPRRRVLRGVPGLPRGGDGRGGGAARARRAGVAG